MAAGILLQHSIGGGVRTEGVHFNAEHARQVFEDAKRISEEFNEPVETPTPYDCTMIENMKKRGDTIVNPIYKWSDYDIWNYIQTKDIKVNPLYEKGYKRVGCVGCPMGNYRSMIREFKDYPTYKLNYIRAFDRMIKVRKEEGLKCEWENGEQVYLWWIGEWKHNVKGQITIDDFLKGEKE